MITYALSAKLASTLPHIWRRGLFGMALHGTFGEFNAAVEYWTAYSDRLEQYLLANDVQDATRRRAILQSGCGAPTYKLIRSLVAPNKPSDHTFKQLVDLLKNHYLPKISVTMQRYRINTRTRQQGQCSSFRRRAETADEVL